MYVMYMSCMSCSWLATDRAPPAFVRFSVSLLFLTRSCSVDGVGGGGGVGYQGHVQSAWNTFLPNKLLMLRSALFRGNF